MVDVRRKWWEERKVAKLKNNGQDFVTDRILGTEEQKGVQKD